MRKVVRELEPFNLDILIERFFHLPFRKPWWSQPSSGLFSNGKSTINIFKSWPLCKSICFPFSSLKVISFILSMVLTFTFCGILYFCSFASGFLRIWRSKCSSIKAQFFLEWILEPTEPTFLASLSFWKFSFMLFLRKESFF